jgi:hypothetical protein
MKRLICLFLSVAMLISPVGGYSAHAQSMPSLPATSSRLMPMTHSVAYTVLKGICIDPKNPLKLDFIIDNPVNKTLTTREFRRLVSYFMAGLTVPQEDFWVNLSPYEKDRVIPDALASTDFGRDLLVQDYILKQLASSLTYPESKAGEQYWQAIDKASAKAGLNRKQVANACSKVWIVPENVEISTQGNFAMVSAMRLKVLTEEDYLASQNLNSAARNSSASVEAFKTYIIPIITKEVNNGARFVRLRQMFYSYALSLWFKNKLKDSFFKYYIDQNKTNGIDLSDKTIKDKVYKQYTAAFKQGAYNFVKSERATNSNKVVKRSYFSGGVMVAPEGGKDGLPAGYNTGKIAGAVVKGTGILLLASTVVQCGGIADAKKPRPDAAPISDASVVDARDAGDALAALKKDVQDFVKLVDGLPLMFDGKSIEVINPYDSVRADGGVADAVTTTTPNDATTTVPNNNPDAAKDVVGEKGPIVVADARLDTAPKLDTNGKLLTDTSSDTLADAMKDVMAAIKEDTGVDSLPDLTADAVADLGPDTTPDTVKDTSTDKQNGGGADAYTPATTKIDTVNHAILGTYKFEGVPTSYWSSANVSLDDVLAASEQALIAKFNNLPQLIADILNTPELQGVNAHALAGYFLRKGKGALATTYWKDINNAEAKSAYIGELIAEAGVLTTTDAAVTAALKNLTSDYKDFYARVIRRIVTFNNTTVDAFVQANPRGIFCY